jgi:hypothetical protein
MESALHQCVISSLLLISLPNFLEIALLGCVELRTCYRILQLVEKHTDPNLGMAVW